MTATQALSAPSAERRVRHDDDPAPGARRARRADRHQVLRHLPQRHPPGQGRVGRLDLPDGPRPRDRGRGQRGRARPSEVLGRRPRRRRLPGGLLRRVRVLPGGRGAVLHQGRRAHVQRPRLRRRADVRRLQPEDRRQGSLRREDPRQPRAAGRGAAAVRRNHDLRAAEALAASDRARRWRSSAWAASATWRCRSLRRWAPR